MMHREVIATKKVGAIAILLFSITVVLYISQGIKLLGLNNYFLGDLLNYGLIVLTVLIIFKEIKNCRMAYRHAIIADKLIINKIQSKQEKNLESIRIADILYIGKKSQVPKEYTKIKSCKSYLSNRVGKSVYCCIYQKGNSVSKFKFQPSDSFIQKIIHHGKLCCELDKNF